MADRTAACCYPHSPPHLTPPPHAQVRAAINNIDQLAPRMAGKAGSINLNITAPVAQPVTDALKAAAGSG